MSDQTTFDAAYWASQPEPVATLQSISDPAARQAAAATLAAQGYVIDVPIDAWSWDPYQVMTLRQQYGYTWVPSALQPPVAIAPGLGQPGVLPYDPLNPPKGSIKVSTNPADFPPIHPPVVAAPLSTVLVGAQSLGNLYLNVVGDTSPDGSIYTDSRGTFTKHVVATPFGNTVYWEKTS